jgi:hypothetical protein
MLPLYGMAVVAAQKGDPTVFVACEIRHLPATYSENSPAGGSDQCPAAGSDN